MYCVVCSAENADDANFCAQCGTEMAVGRNAESTAALAAVPAVDPEQLPVAPASQAVGVVELVVFQDVQEVGRVELGDQVVTIGRQVESSVVLEDDAVSRRHSELTPTDAGFVVADVGSLNGTFVNGRRVDSAPLTEQDVLQVGPFTLRLVGVSAGRPSTAR